MTYKEFENTILKKEGPKKFKVSSSWGVYDAYKYIRKNKWFDIGRPVKEFEFYGVIRKVNDLLAKELAEGKEITFPHRMGKLELRKSERYVSIVDGNLKIGYPIDWNKTLKLWYSDEQARKNKTLLRNETPFVYKVKYCVHDANYNNKSFYKFSLNRFIKKALKDNINNKTIDTAW